MSNKQQTETTRYVTCEIVKVEAITSSTGEDVNCKRITIKVLNPEPDAVYVLDRCNFGPVQNAILSLFPNWDMVIADHPKYVELSIRVQNALKNSNILYLGALCLASEHELLRIPNFGKKSIKEIQAFLGIFGYSLGIDPTKWHS